MRASNPSSRGHTMRVNGRISLNRMKPVIKNFEYKPISIVGRGAFGVVYLAKNYDGRLVAIKRVLQDPMYLNREEDILQRIECENCVRMITSFKSVAQPKHELYLNIVMEYMPMNLDSFIEQYRNNKMYIPPLYAKLFAFQMISGLHYLHSLRIMHRDIKPANILVNPETGALKICDFGSAKIYQSNEKSISYIASRFYRAPELNMECQTYSCAIDIWSAGCVIAEMVNGGIPLFQGKDTLGQLEAIAQLIGKPTAEDLKSFPHRETDFYKDFDVIKKKSLREVLPRHVKNDLISLLESIFVYQPRKRPTAYKLMQHPYFDELFTTKIKMPNNNPFPTLVRNPKKRAAISANGLRFHPLKGFRL